LIGWEKKKGGNYKKGVRKKGGIERQNEKERDHAPKGKKNESDNLMKV